MVIVLNYEDKKFSIDLEKLEKQAGDLISRELNFTKSIAQSIRKKIKMADDVKNLLQVDLHKVSHM